MKKFVINETAAGSENFSAGAIFELKEIKRKSTFNMAKVVAIACSLFIESFELTTNATTYQTNLIELN